MFPDNFPSSSCWRCSSTRSRRKFGPLERFQMQAIGIEKGKPFKPDDKTESAAVEAARLGGAMARANTYASPRDGVFYYPDRKWQHRRRADLHLHPGRRSSDRRPQQRLLHGALATRRQ